MNKITDSQSTLLDAIRGLSAVAVLVGHGLTMLPDAPDIGTRYPIQRYGVVLFFALSGFLIAYNCMRRDRYTFGEYMIDRFARIFTAFIPALILVALIDPLFKTVSAPANSIETFIANAAMLHHTPFDRFFDWLPHFPSFGSGRQFWTIAVEWWLYVLFGSLFFLSRSTWNERAVMALLAPASILVVLFFTTRESIGLVWFAGAAGALAFCSAAPSDALRRLALPALGCFVVAVFFRFLFLNPGVPFNALDVNFLWLTAGLFFALLMAVPQMPRLEAALAGTKPFWKWLSEISYSLYLTHQTLHYLWQAKFGVVDWVSLTAMCLASIVLAWAFTWAFDERHKDVAMAIKRWVRLPPRPPTGPHVA